MGHTAGIGFRIPKPHAADGSLLYIMPATYFTTATNYPAFLPQFSIVNADPRRKESWVQKPDGKDHTSLSVNELQKERKRLSDELLAKDAPQDAFERVAALNLRKAETDNPVVRELVCVEAELRKRAAFSR